MPDTELFLSLAGIAGVFVGFGALIALRSRGPGDTFDVMMIGMVVWVAIAVVIIALAPVAVSGFGVTGHALWLACSVIALLVFFAGDEVVVRASGAPGSRNAPNGGLCALLDRLPPHADRHRAGPGPGPRGGALLHGSSC